jgi:DNA-binding protein HU-beta
LGSPERNVVNKAQLIEALSEYYNGSKAEAGRALNAVVETITHKTALGEKVSITGFGVFEKVQRSARMVRNPRTGERKRANATAVPRFRAGSDLKAFVSGAKSVPKATTKAPATATIGTKTSAAKKSPAAAQRTGAKKSAAAKTRSATAKTAAAKKSPAAKKSSAANKGTPAEKSTTARTAAKRTGV